MIGVFGQKSDEVIVRFSRTGQSDSFALGLFGKPFLSNQADNEVSLDFGQAGGPAIVNAQAGMAGQRPAMIVGGTSFASTGKPEFLKLSLEEMREMTSKPRVARFTPEMEVAVTRLIVGLPNKQRISIQFGSMGPPMASMRTCVNDLIKSWGYDPAVLAGLTRLPEPLDNPGTWAGPNDYPRDALIKGKGGIVRFRLDVDVEGKVNRCAILELSAGPELNQKTCEILRRRARFKPALDANGKPVAAYFASSVRWAVPR